MHGETCVSLIGRVRDFEVIDTVALGVAFSWDKEGQPITSVIFERNSPLPSVKLLTFYRCACCLMFSCTSIATHVFKANTGAVYFPVKTLSRSVMCMAAVCAGLAPSEG